MARILPVFTKAMEWHPMISRISPGKCVKAVTVVLIKCVWIMNKPNGLAVWPYQWYWCRHQPRTLGRIWIQCLLQNVSSTGAG